MVELSSVVSVFSTLIYTDKGRSFQGYIGAAPKVTVHFTGLLTPVRLLSVPIGQVFQAGEIVIDRDGIRYLAGNWAASSLLGHGVCENFVLFEVHAYVEWTRSVSTVEPISGGRREGTPQVLGTIGVLREPLSLQNDSTGIPVQRFRYLIGPRPQVDDFIEGKRIRRIDFVNGIYYAEAQ